MDEKKLHIGTCSWKYESWQDLVYSTAKPDNYLAEYSRLYSTVEIDQWFWSLFPGSDPVLPNPSVVREYAESVPDDFRFGIKVPNSLTLTHYYKKKKSDPLRANPHFLSIDLMERFLERLGPLAGKTGPLLFQFGYLNKMMLPGLDRFLEHFGRFAEKLPPGYTYCLESRNPNYLNRRYFDFLRQHDLHHVFLQGYYMPPIFDIYRSHREAITETAVIRLHGPDRGDIEQQTGKKWHKIVSPKDGDIAKLTEMTRDLLARSVETFVFVNNHFEGSAPRTISRIEGSLQGEDLQ